jgi:hypothetical protein
VKNPDPRDEPRPRRPDDPRAFEVVSYLWGEYQYRHDMVWKLSFGITAVAAALVIAPFLARESVQKAVGWGLLALPALAIVVILGGLFTLQSELGRLDRTRKAYRKAQDDVLGPYVSANELEKGRVTPDKPEKLDDLSERLWRWIGSLQFAQRVRLYLVVLLVGAIIYIGLLARLWFPDLID